MEVEAAHQCPECPYATTKPSDLKKHILFHSKTKDYVCEECKKRFTTSSDLSRHERIHTNVHSFHCSYDNCSFSAFQKPNLLAHEETHKSIESRRLFPCDLCCKKFSRKSILKKHKVKCCGEVSPEAAKPNYCDKCQKTFSTGYKLKIHEKSHTGELLFRCTSCKNAFASNEALVKHSLIHQEKAFKCQKCEKKFSRKDHLKQHMRVHNKSLSQDQVGDKPLDFLCGLCGMTFNHTQKEVLLQHLVAHHPGNSQTNVETSFHDIVAYEEFGTGKILLATSDPTQLREMGSEGDGGQKHVIVRHDGAENLTLLRVTENPEHHEDGVADIELVGGVGDDTELVLAEQTVIVVDDHHVIVAGEEDLEDRQLIYSHDIENQVIIDQEALENQVIISQEDQVMVSEENVEEVTVHSNGDGGELVIVEEF